MKPVEKISAIPAESPEAIAAIRQAVSRVIYPPLTPLRGVLLALQAGARKQRAAMVQERDQIHRQGFAAATRLMLTARECTQLEAPTNRKALNNEPVRGAS